MDIISSLNANLSHALVIELTVFDTDQVRLSECAAQWLTDGVREFAGRDILREVGRYRISKKGSLSYPALSRRGGANRWGCVAVAPQDTLEVRYNPYTLDVLPWLRQAIVDRAESISVTSGVFRQDGEIGESDLDLAAKFDDDLPEYVKLIVEMDEQDLRAPKGASAVQDNLLRTVRWACDRYNVVFGHVSYRHACEETELEYFLRGSDGDPTANTPHWKSHLRGYSWLMVVPEQVARTLGGADALRASGAFHSVTALPNQALLLQATPTFREYRGAAVAKVHRVMRDVLISGEFRKPAPLPGLPPPDMIVLPA
ncbi:hypothetical protein ACGFNV_09850 [Streptomyces sp. NPDC048751]|uniref:hypothetical protein n=1 Tax=Streptomyces sp. NPDC048751 TaxID=3365591 RepID=UPI00371C1522